eukprot:Partr_v1_DN28612_c0_g1_i5_m50199 putative protein RIC1 homolog
MHICVGAAKRLDAQTPDRHELFSDGSEDVHLVDSPPSVSPTSAGSASGGVQSRGRRGGEREVLVALARSPSGNFFASCSATSVFLWSMRPAVLLSKVVRSADSLESAGPYKLIVWSPDSKRVSAITDDGHVHIFVVIAPSQAHPSLLQYDFGNERYWQTGPGQARGVPNYTLVLTAVVHIMEGVRACVGFSEYMLLSTDSPSMIFALAWSGERYERQEEVQAILESLPDDSVTVCGVYYDKLMDLFAFILSDNSIYISLHKSHFTTEGDFEDADRETMIHDSEVSPERKVIHFPCVDRSLSAELPFQPACISLNARHRLVAVGSTAGDVFVYHLNNEFQLFFSHKVANSSNFPLTLVSSMSWTSDGNALAVSYEKGGFAIVTAFGRLLFSTALDELDMEAGQKSNDIFLFGVTHLFWGLGNFELFLLPTLSADYDGPSYIFTVPFAKYAILTCNLRDNMRHPFLIGDDRLLIHSGTDVDSSPFNNKTMVWQVVQIPAIYMGENWPIKHAASSADGRKIAVAGKRGFAICNTSTDKWKVFGNQQHERSFMCLGGLLWFKDLVVVASQDSSTFQNELRVYHGEQNLDNSNILHTETFKRRIILINIIYNHILVYTADNVVHQFVIEYSGNNFTFESVRTCQLPQIRAPLAVQYIDWFIPAVNDNVQEALRNSSLLLLKEGKLSIVDPNSNKQIYKLSDRIEFCWPYFPRRPIGDLYNIIWAFDGQQTKVWFNIMLIPSNGFELVCRNIADPLLIPLDFYPMSVLFHKGIIVGVEQNMSFRYVDGVCFKSNSKTYLFLHDIIQYFLQKKHMAESVRYASYYQEYDYFGHSMEILCHRVLEKEAESLIGFHEDALLPSVVQFLRSFPHFYDVIVRCARKTEVALWDYLFSIVGNPRDMFNACLEEGDLRTATSFLVILQTMEPFSVSSKLQVDLIEKTLELEDFELTGEIVRYLNSVTRSKLSEDDLLKATGPRTGLLAVSAEEEQTFYIDILMSRHARALMMRQKMRKLGKLAQAVNFPLADWLRKERNRSAMITDFSQTFRKLHAEFEWPYPSETMKSPVSTASDGTSPKLRRNTLPPPGSVDDIGSPDGLNMMSKRNQFDSQSIASSFGELPESPQLRRRAHSSMSDQLTRRLSHRGDLEDEIRALMTATKLAKCYQWSILLATMVLDLGAVVEILQEARKEEENVDLFERYKAVLLGTGSLVYRSFVTSVEQVVGLV